MAKAADRPWTVEQQQRLDEFRVPRTVDIHCHCLPGFDDGPATLEDAVALCGSLIDDGITTVIATPHQLGRYDRLNDTREITAAVNDLLEHLNGINLPLEIFPGGDVRVDERLPRLLDAGEVGTAADAGRHILLELPHELFLNPLPTIDLLRKRGIQAIMTHPERHRYLKPVGDWAYDWIEHGAVLQVTAGSLTGEFGPRAHDHAWQLLSEDLVSLVATDAHDTRRRPPQMSAAIEILNARVGTEMTRLIAIDNPLRVLHGETIPPPST